MKLIDVVEKVAQGLLAVGMTIVTVAVTGLLFVA